MRKVNLSKLAEGYDLLSRLNKDYRELLQIYSEKISDMNLPKDSKILDIASGTGNFTLEIIKQYPEAKIYSLEYDRNFLNYQKAKILPKQNILLINGDAQHLGFSNETIDLVSLIHALNYIPDQSQTLNNIYRVLKPNGYFIIADIGRCLDFNSKAKELILDSIKENGIFKTAYYLWKVRKNAKENRIFSKNQLKGVYPTHNLSDFSSLISQHGFQIEFSSDKFYGGLDDFIVARKLV